jgi:hypothetical protein
MRIYLMETHMKSFFALTLALALTLASLSLTACGAMPCGAAGQSCNQVLIGGDGPG